MADDSLRRFLIEVLLLTKITIRNVLRERVIH
jgi:hypothetical protein